MRSVIKFAMAAPSFLYKGINMRQPAIFTMNETAITKKIIFSLPSAKLIVHR